MTIANKHHITSNWTIIFSDILALILSFAILLYSMRTINEPEQNLFYSIFSFGDVQAVHNTPLPTTESKPLLNTKYLRTLLKSRLENSDEFAETSLILHDDASHIIADIILPPTIQHDLQQQQLSAQSIATLRRIQQLLHGIDNTIYLKFNVLAQHTQHIAWSDITNTMLKKAAMLQKLGFMEQARLLIKYNKTKNIDNIAYSLQQDVISEPLYVITLAIANE